MDIPVVVWIAGGITAIVVAVGIAAILRSRRINLTQPQSPGQRPEWMKTTPPEETIAATQADGEGITLYDHDPGERLAAPFAEQIEDIVRAKIEALPNLAATKIDLGTSPDGRLEIWIDGVSYADVSLLPDERLRQIFLQAIEEWRQKEG